jgi:hypothetical protein
MDIANKHEAAIVSDPSRSHNPRGDIYYIKKEKGRLLSLVLLQENDVLTK